MSLIQFIKIGADGQPLPEGSTDKHVAVLLPQIGWMLSATVIKKKGMPQKELLEAAKKVDLLGFNDWELPEIGLLKLVSDHTRYGPALNPEFFYDIPLDWLWSSTECAWSKDEKPGVASSAWFVHSFFGLVSYYLRFNDGFGLAARRVGQ